MCHAIYSDIQIIAEFPEDVSGKKILDVACGYGNLARLILSYRGDSCKRELPLIIGIDMDMELLRYSNRFRNYNDLVCADARHIPFKDNTFDIVAAIEIIEHVSKEDGYALIKELERVAKTKVLITTPNGFNPGWGHQCGWRAGEFRRLGFKVRGIGSKLSQKTKSKRLAYLFYLLFTPFSYFLPILSSNLIATKYLQKDELKIPSF